MTIPPIGRSRLAGAAALSVSAMLLACLVWLPAPTAAGPAGATLAGGVVVSQMVGTGPGGAGVVYNGDRITYTIFITNNGASAASNVLVIDALPPDALDGIACDGGCEQIVETTVFPEPTGGTVEVTVTRSISWTLASLPPGAQVRKTVTGRVTGQPDGTVVANRVFLSYSDGSPSSEVQTTVRVRIEQTGQSVLSSVATWFSKDLGGTISQDWGDFDRDGSLDLALASSVGLGVYRNEAGHLVKFWSDARQAYGVAWGDFLGNGKLALVAVGDSVDDSPSSVGLNYVYRQQGSEFVQTGVFTSDYQLVRLVAGDFRGSGNIDLIASTNAINSPCPVRLYRNDGAGNFQTGADNCISTSATAAIGAADFDNDGDLDLALGIFPHRARVFINNGAGRFLNSLPLDDYLTFLPYDLKWGDYDGDGYLDLAAAFPMQRQARVYRNRQGTGFDPPIIIQTQLFWTPLTVDWADFHGTGRMDLAVADSPPGIYQYEGASFHLTSHLAADSINGRIWSLRGVRILPEGDLALAVSNRDGPSLLFDGFSPHLSESILPVDATPAGGVAWGDADGDGMLDLLLGAGSPPVVDSRIYYNFNGVITGASKPVLVPSGLGPQNVSFADVDLNGSLDIAIGGASESQIYLAGQTNRAWASPLPNARGHVVAWADADNNGTLDLLTAGYGGPVNLFLNGNGALGASAAFTTVLTGNVTSLAWCDIDKDGFPDFAVGNDGQPARVFHNNRNNTFSLIWDSGFTSHTTSIACADFNADSYPDLAIGSYQQGTVIFENSNGALSTKPIWSSPTLSKTTSIAWGDWNNDGYPELAIGNDGEPDQVFANLASSPGAPRLFWTWTSREMNATTGVAWGDYNGDGYLDLAVSQNGGGQSGIYQNTTVRPAHLSDVFTPTMLLPNSPSYVWIQRPGRTADGYLNSSAEILSGPEHPTVTIRYRVFNPDGSRVLAGSNFTGTAIARTYFEYSVDGGSTWRRASRAAGSPAAITQTTRLGVDGVFLWNAVADQAISDDARFRVRVVDEDRAGPVQRASTSAISPPFRIRATSCTWPENPRIYYYPINPPPETPVNFIGTVDAGSGSLSFVWDFGDGGDFGFGQTIQHAFAQAATQAVTLTVTGEACPINRERVVATLVSVGIGTPEYRVYLPLVSNNAAYSATESGRVYLPLVSNNAAFSATASTSVPAPGATGSPSEKPTGRTDALRIPPAPPAWGGSSMPGLAGTPYTPLATGDLTPPGSPCSLTKVSGVPVGISDQPAGNATGLRIAFWSTADLTGNNRDGSIEIFLADSDATGAVTYTQVTSSTGSVLGGFNFSPSLDASGRRLAFYTERDLTGGNQDGNFEIFLAEIGAGGAVTIRQLTTTTIGANILPTISADGARIAFASDRNLTNKNPDGNSEIVLATVDAAGTITYSVVTKTSGGLNDQLAFSSDGTRIAFISDRDLTGDNAGGNQQVFVATLGLQDGGPGNPSYVQLTPASSTASGAVGRPALNADGSRIAFASNRNLTGRNPGQTWQIFVASVDLAGAVSLSMITDPALGSYDQPALNADGTRIVFVSSSDQAVMLFDSIINAFFQLTAAGADSFGPAIDAQGTHISFVANRAVYAASCPLVDLAVSKTAEPASVLAGDGLAYTLVITNRGPSQATNVQLTDNLPAQLEEVIPPDQVDDDNSATGFGGGAVHATLWSTATSALQLDAPSGPVAAELPDRQANGFVNMAGNVLLLHLNELTGATTFTDSSGLGNGASCPVISCPVRGVAGKIDRGLSFNGLDNYLTVPNAASVDFDGHISMAAWVSSTTTNGNRTIIGHGPSSAPAPLREVFLRIKDGKYQVGYQDELGDSPVSFPIPVGDVGNWIHLAGVYDGAAWRLYRNGILLSPTATPYGAVTVPANWGIGAAGDGRSRFFSGQLDEVAVWNRDLSSDEVLEIYNRQAPFFAGFAGSFDSRMLDARAPVPWQTLSWTPSLPMGKQLLDGGQVESGYPLGNIDMTGNTLLLHFAEASGALTFGDTSGLGKSAICGPLGCPAAGAAGKFGRAVRFNGAGNLLTVMDATNPTAYTLEAWVKADSASSGSIIARTDASGPTSHWSHQLRITTAGKFEHYTDDGNPKSVVGTTTLVPGLWYHVAGVAASNGLMRLYVNGQEEGTAVPIGNLVVGRDRWLLGSNSGNGIGYFAGFMDEAAIFNRALPASAIQDHYLRGALQARFQVRSCGTVSCTLGTEGFIGPDGTSATYYSEISNTTTALPAIPISVASNRYFQYHLALETDNVQQIPRMQRVAVGPSHQTIVTSQGVCDGIRGVNCSLGKLEAGATATVTIISQVSPYARGEIINNANVHSAETERNHGNNSATVATRILADTDLAVSQTTNLPIAVAGLPYSYTVVVTNNGPKPATGVILRGLLPQDSSLPYLPPECGAYDGSLLTCQLASLPAGQTWNLPLVVKVSPGTRGAITNKVSVASAETDPNTGNNSSVAVNPVVAVADLSVVTTAANEVAAGTPLTYTLSIKNWGPSLATGVVVTNSLPPSATQVITSSAAFSLTGSMVTWTVSNLAPSAEIAISLAVTVNGSARGLITNTAGVAATESDPALPNNTHPRTTNVVGVADLLAEKLASSSTLTVGQPLTYSLIITNAGPSDALGAVLTDTLPTSVTVSSVLPAGYCTSSGERLVCDLGTILANETTTLTLATLVHPKAPAGVITNSLVVTSSTGDPDPGTNTALASTSLRTMANLAIGKTTPLTILAGENLTYSLAVTNTGPSDATNVLVTDTLPSGVTFQSASPGCTASWPSVNCTLGSLTDTPGANTRGITITVGVPSSALLGALITNSAAVGAAEADDYPVDNSIVVTTTVQRLADLTIAKSASVEPVLAGDMLTYTLSLTNNGPSDASAVVVTDHLPVSVTFASASSPCLYDAGAVTCPVASLTAGSNLAFTVAVTVPSSIPQGTQLTNTAVAGAAEDDANTVNNSSTVTSSVLARADLAIAKWAPGATVFAGNRLTYTLAITNAGPSDALTVIITDVLPDGVSLLSWPSGWATSTVMVTGSLGTMTALASQEFTVVVGIPSSAPAGLILTNTATVGTSTTDPAGANNTRSTHTSVQTQADLVIAKYAAPDPVFLGNLLTYTVVVTNYGPSDAAPMVITDILPSGVTLLSTDASAGTCGPVGNPVTCTLAAAVPGVYTVTLHTSVSASTAGYMTNTAGVTSTTADPNPANSVVQVTTLAQTQADLSITKSASASTRFAGEYLTYTLTITNGNVYSVTSVVVTDTLPSGVITVSLPVPCTAAGSAIRCDLGTLSPGASQVITLPVRVDPAAPAGQITNTAGITSATNIDPSPANNSAYITTTVHRQADLSVSKAVYPAPPMPKQELVYTVTVTNAGPSLATDVTLTDTLPTKVDFSAVWRSQGNCSGTSVITCILGDLDPLATAQVVITGTVQKKATELVNRADVSANELDFGPTPNSFTLTTTVQQADLALTKSASPDPVVAGGMLTYTLNITNSPSSLQDATSVVVTDQLPISVTFVSATPSYTPIDATGTVTWQLGTINKDASRVITISVRIWATATAGSLVNTAGVDAAETDPNEGDNSDTITTTVTRRVDLFVTKAADTAVIAGAEVTYTLTVTNNGPSQSSSSTLTDTIPISSTFAWASGSPLPPAGRDVTWTLGLLAPGASVTRSLAITVDAAASGTLTNTTSVAGNETDLAPGNNSFTVTTTVDRLANLTLAGSTIGADVSAGHQLSYTLVVSNTGPSQATGVMVSDTLATGVAFAEASPSVTINPAGSVVTWTVGTLEPQTGVTLTLLVTVTGDASTITNTAWLWGTETGPAAAITSVVTNTVYTAAPLTVTISGPSAGTIGETSLFTATTNVTASFPITFVWSISSTEIITQAVLYRLTDTVTYKWADSGSNAITTTVANAAGSVTNSITTTIALIPSGLVASRPRDAHIYLPLVQRAWPPGGP